MKSIPRERAQSEEMCWWKKFIPLTFHCLYAGRRSTAGRRNGKGMKVRRKRMNHEEREKYRWKEGREGKKISHIKCKTFINKTVQLSETVVE